MDAAVLREVRVLRTSTTLVTVACLILALCAFAAQNRKVKFEELDVERINIVESNGQIKLVIANKERLPGPVIGGKTYERVGLKSPGILFYNDKGDESGGLRTASSEAEGKYVAGAGLAFDKYNGDEVIGIRYNDDNGTRTVSLRILDQPDASPAEQKKNFEQARKLPPGPERDALRRQAVANQPVLVGTSVDKAAAVTLFDGNSRPRIRLSVTVEGEAKLEFLDVDGKVVQALPARGAAVNR
jgi:hypothetical protein